MRVLVVGAGGMLGQEVVRAFADRDEADHGVVGLTRADLDITHATAVGRVVPEIAPDVIVNAAAWTDVDGCEADPDRAHWINAEAAGFLATAARDVGATLVHISTDYVFGGPPPTAPDGTPRGWAEDDPIAPASVYGRSKAEGEAHVRATHIDSHIVRTAWLSGAGGPCFVRTMLALAERGDPIRVVDDQHGSPTFAADLAAALRALVTTSPRVRPGTWHRTNAGWCSWYDLAAATFELAGLDVDLRRQPSSALRRAAPRPSWSVLSDGRAAAAGLAPLPPWRDGLARLLDELGVLT